MQIKFPVHDTKPETSLTTVFWKQKEKLFIALALVVMGSVFLAKGLTGKERLMGEYFQAGNYQSKYKALAEVDEKGLLRLLKKHPELNPLFSHHLEQSYVLKGNLQLAKIQAGESLKRLTFINPLYQDYAKVSLLMEEGRFDEALIRSIAIGELLNKDELPNLYGINLVRITFLEAQLKKLEAPIKKWEEVKSLISNELFLHFSDENLSLLDFATHTI